MDNYLYIGLILFSTLAISLIFLSYFRKKTKPAIKTPPISAAKLQLAQHELEPRYSNAASFEADDEPAVESQQSFNFDAAPENHEPNAPIEDDFLILMVVAKPGTRFASYDLLQAISTTGMQFGAMNFFHYYTYQHDEKKTLFSLSAATQSGEFNLDNIGDFSCSGLIFFMNLPHVYDPQFSFSKMLVIAQQLADDLDGELRSDPKTPWSDAVLRQYQQKINALHDNTRKHYTHS